MSQIFSMLSLGNALAEIAAGYAKLHQGGGDTAGLGAALQQAMQAQGGSADASIPTDTPATDTCDISQDAIDLMLAYQASHPLPVHAGQQTADLGLAPAVDTDALANAMAMHRNLPAPNPLPTIQTLANINDLYQAGNYAATQNFNVYA